MTSQNVYIQSKMLGFNIGNNWLKKIIGFKIPQKVNKSLFKEKRKEKGGINIQIF